MKPSRCSPLPGLDLCESETLRASLVPRWPHELPALPRSLEALTTRCSSSSWALLPWSRLSAAQRARVLLPQLDTCPEVCRR